MRVEPVAWASCQPYLPCTFFSLLSVWAYVEAGGIRASTAPRPAGGVVRPVRRGPVLARGAGRPAGGLAGPGCVPAEAGRAGPRRCAGRSWGQALREKVTFVALSLAFVAIAIAARRPSFSSVSPERTGYQPRRGCYGLWFYLAKTCWPRDSLGRVPGTAPIDWRSTPFAPAIVATVAISLLGYALRRRFPALLASWICYVAILGPNSGLVRINDQIAADRYGYLSMTVWAVLAAGLLERAWRRWAGRRGVAVAAAAIVTLLVILAFLSRQQCRTWRDSKTLWAHALTHGAEASSVAHYNLGLVLQREGRLAAAAAHYGEAMRFDPHDPEVQNNLGVVLQRQGKLEEAEARYTEALRLKPDSVDAHYNLGSIFSRRGRFAEAEAQYAEALRLRPDTAIAYHNLGADLFRQGKYAEAAARFVQALRLDPGRADTHSNLGLTLSPWRSMRKRRPIMPRCGGSIPATPRARKDPEDLERTPAASPTRPGPSRP